MFARTFAVFVFSFNAFPPPALIDFPRVSQKRMTMVARAIVIFFQVNYISMSLSITMFFFLLEMRAQSLLRTDFPEFSYSLREQMALHGNLFLVIASYYALIHISIVILFRMTLDNAYVIYRLRVVNRLYSSIKRLRMQHNLVYICMTTLNIRLVNKMNPIFSRVSMVNIALDVPICGAVMVELIIGQINDNYLMDAMQIFVCMAATILGMHVLFAQYPGLIYRHVKRVIHFNCYQPLRALSIHNRLKLSTFIQSNHTEHPVGIHYGPLNVITVASFLGVS